MNQHRFDALITATLPIAFVGSGFLNMLAYVVGLHSHDSLRKLVTLGIIGLVTLLLLAKVCLLWCKRPETRPILLRAACIPVLLGVLYLVALIVQPDKTMVLKEAVINGGYLVSACCALLIICLEGRVLSFLRTCRIYACVIAPIIVFYCIRFYLPGAEYGVSDLGVLSYMPLAYTLFEFCLFLFLEILLTSADRPDVNRVNCGLMALFSIAIALSGTKGTMLCMAFFCVLSGVCMLLRDMPRRWLRLPAACLLTMVLFCTVLFPQNGGFDNRFLSFLTEVSSGEVAQYSNQEYTETLDLLNQLPPTEQPPTEQPPTEQPPTEQSPTEQPPTEQPPTEQPPVEVYTPPVQSRDVVDAVISGEVDEALASGALSQEEYDAVMELFRNFNNTATGQRTYLWKSALFEISSAPITGHGPMAFQTKYGTYPHNLFLEIGADFGLVALLAILILGAYTFWILIRRSMQEPLNMAFTLYVFSYLPQMMLSGSLYSNSVFFQYGFCLLFVLYAKGFETVSKQEIVA